MPDGICFEYINLLHEEHKNLYASTVLQSMRKKDVLPDFGVILMQIWDRWRICQNELVIC
jgi:hypothetical protein